MVKAFTTSPGSKEAKESLAEANRGYKEYTEVWQPRSVLLFSVNTNTFEPIRGDHIRLFSSDSSHAECSVQNMCVLENDMENHLGEFHIRMKGNKGYSYVGKHLAAK